MGTVSKMNTYSPDFIYGLQSKYELTDELLIVFEGINEMFKTSSQYIDMKKRINLNVKWKLKKKEDITSLNIIFNALNRLCTTNFDTILEEIKGVEITTALELDKLSQSIIEKMLHEEQFIETYVALIYNLIVAGRWITSESTFRQVLMDKLHIIYELLIKDKSDQNDRSKERGLFKIIAKMFKAHLISKMLISNLMDNQQLIYESTNNEKYMENFIILWLAYPEYKEDYITSIKETISKRLQFMLMDNEIISVVPTVYTKPSIEYTNYIVYMDEYNTVQDMIIDVGKNGNYIQFMGVVLRHTIDHSKDINLIIKIIKQGLSMKIWSKRDILAAIEHIKTVELSDIAIDAPYYKQHLDRIIKDFLSTEKQDKEYRYKKGKYGNKSVR